MNSDALVEKFIYSCSHDLRGPVTSIQGLIKLVEQHPESISKEDCIRMIGECSGKLDRLIHGLQEFMEIEAMKIEPEPVQILDAVDIALEEFKNQIEEHHLIIERNDRPLIWKTNFRCIVEILKKVISNSVIFRDTGKKSNMIAIDAMQDQGKLLLKVRDNGIGIPADFQSRLFNVFSRAHASSKGPGLGLFLVNRIVRKLAGDVIVNSQEGMGTTVTIRLPTFD